MFPCCHDGLTELTRTILLFIPNTSCVYHSDTSTLNIKSTTSNNFPEYFEAIPNEILSHIRFPIFVNIAEQRFGFESKLIIECILENGKMRLSQLVLTVASFYRNSDITLNDPKIVMIKKQQIIKSNVMNLLSEQYLKPSRPRHSINPTDLAMAWEQQMISDLPGVPAPKDIKEIKQKVSEKFNVAADEAYEEMKSFANVRHSMLQRFDRQSI